jgi:hypothetical protein
MFLDATGRISSRNPDILVQPPAHKWLGLAEKWKALRASGPIDVDGIKTKLIEVHFGNLELECVAVDAGDEGLLAIAPHAEEFLFQVGKIKADSETRKSQGAAAVVWKAFMRDASAQTTYQRNRHLFTSADVITHLLKALEFQFPRAVEYRRMQANQAHKQGFLRSKFGFERQFYNVIRRAETGGYTAGSDYQNAIVFCARNHAACILGLAASGPIDGAGGHGAGGHIHYIAPLEDAFGQCGFLLEVPFDTDAATINGAVGLPRLPLLLPNGNPWAVGQPKVKS